MNYSEARLYALLMKLSRFPKRKQAAAWKKLCCEKRFHSNNGFTFTHSLEKLKFFPPVELYGKCNNGATLTLENVEIDRFEAVCNYGLHLKNASIKHFGSNVLLGSNQNGVSLSSSTPFEATAERISSFKGQWLNCTLQFPVKTIKPLRINELNL